MKKFTTLAAVSALALSVAAPVSADTNTQSDPFVSTQGSGLGTNAGLAIIGGLFVIVAVAASSGT